LFKSGETSFLLTGLIIFEQFKAFLGANVVGKLYKIIYEIFIKKLFELY